MAHVAPAAIRRPRDEARKTLPAVVDAVKALAHPGRLRILAMLRGGDLCVCQMTAVLELAASTVSAHLSDLRRAGLVTERKTGRWVHYHLVDDGTLAELVRQALQLVDGDDRLDQDARVLSALRRVPLATFCLSGFGRMRAGLAPGRPKAARQRGTTGVTVGTARRRGGR